MKNPLLTTEKFEMSVRVAEKVGGAIQYGIDGSLILVAQGEVGRDIYPVVKEALKLAQEKLRAREPVLGAVGLVMGTGEAAYFDGKRWQLTGGRGFVAKDLIRYPVTEADFH